LDAYRQEQSSEDLLGNQECSANAL
jgi:hypothetical protein